MSFDIPLLGTILLGLLALGALAVAWGLPDRRETASPAVWISEDELQREWEDRGGVGEPARPAPDLSCSLTVSAGRSGHLHLGRAALANQHDRRNERDHRHDRADQERAREAVGERDVGGRRRSPGARPCGS